MTREEANKVLLNVLQEEIPPEERQAIDIALDSIAAVDRLTKVLDSYTGGQS